MNRFNNLLGGTRSRLREMRAYADRWNSDEKKKARGVCSITWRNARAHGLGTIRSDAHGARFSDCGAHAHIPESVLHGLRFQYANETETAKNRYARDQNHGWYADEFCDRVYRPFVCRLPARAGASVWIAGYVEREGGDDGSPTGYAVVSCTRGAFDTFSDERSAVNEADRIAERMAEDAREWDEKWQEASRASDQRENARADYKAAAMRACMALQALRDQRAKGDGVADTVCALIVQRVRECREEMRDALRTIRAKSAEIERLDVAGEF